MSDQSGTRSVKIGADERTGWSSDRPRRDGGGPERKPDISVRGRVLDPAFRLRYTPGSLVLVAAPDRAAAETYMHTVLEDRAALLSTGRVERLLRDRGADPAQAPTLVEAAAMKRLNGGDAVVLVLDRFDPETRERWLRAAAGLRRPRHLVLLDGAGGDDEDRELLGDLRKALMADALGEEGFHTAIRLGGKAAGDVKRIVFRPPPRDDD